MMNTIAIDHEQELFHLFNYKEEIDVNKFSYAKSIFEMLNEDLLEKLDKRTKAFNKTLSEIQETKYTFKDCLSIIENYEKLTEITSGTIQLLAMFELDEPVFRKLNKRLIKFNEQNKQILDKIYLYKEVYSAKQEFEEGNTLSFEEVFEDEL